MMYYEHMKGKNIFTLVGAIAISEMAGIIGSIFTANAITTWYSTLIKPALNPPSWVFGPVWTILYALMGVAAFLVWKKGIARKEVKRALIVFAIQLGLNTLWSILFFGLQNPGVAFIEIVLLWFTILATIIAFTKVSKIAAALLVPYILWVSFASYLNFAIWMAN